MQAFDHPFATLRYQWLDRQAPETVLLIHSLGTSLEIWQETIEALGPEVNVLSYDLPGHGLSEAPRQTGLLPAYAEQVAALLDHCQVRRTTVVGLSIGGMIALQLTLTTPQRIQRLILSNTAARIGSQASWQERIEAVQAQGLAAMAPGVMERWLSLGYRQAHPAATRLYEQMLQRSDQAGYLRACELLREADLRQEVAQIAVPTLCLGGTEDQGTPPATLEALAGQIPGAELYLFPGAGHLPCIEQPAAFAEQVKRWMSRGR